MVAIPKSTPRARSGSMGASNASCRHVSVSFIRIHLASGLRFGLEAGQFHVDDGAGDAAHVRTLTELAANAQLAVAAPHLEADAVLVSLAKGLERGTGMRMSEVAAEVLRRWRAARVSR